MNEIKVNVNHKVKVKLTNLGKAVHLRNHLKYFKDDLENHPYREPKEDKEGCTEYVFWELISVYGPEMYHGTRPMFKENSVTISLQN